MASEKLTILVVEDDAEMNELQRELLSLHEMDSIAAYSGVEALELAKEHKPDAVMLDVMLPEMDGFETCQHLRAQQGDRKMPIVMLTALDTEDCRARGFECGADAYFIKPFDPDEVISTIQVLIAE